MWDPYCRPREEKERSQKQKQKQRDNTMEDTRKEHVLEHR